MPETLYTFAVARVRTKELSLLDSQALEQLLATRSYDDSLHFLHDKGWGSADGGEDAERILRSERKKTWDFIRELSDDLSLFDVFLYANDYHNLKVAVKSVYSGQKPDLYFIENATLEPDIILKAVTERDFSLLPQGMREPAQEAFQTLLHTGDGQLCDLILDKASLQAVYTAGVASGNDLLKQYAEITVASADIRIAVRCCKTRKPYELIFRSLAECSTLDITSLAQAAGNNMDSICDYLTNTAYARAAEALKQSMTAFERWSDNAVIHMIRPQQHNPFTIAPLAAYILARDNEIKAVRMILSAKRNQLPEESIRERLREMYV